MKMLNTELIFVLELLYLLLRCFLIVLLILLGRLNSLVEVLTYEQNLAVFIIEIFQLDFGPGQVAKLFDNPVNS